MVHDAGAAPGRLERMRGGSPTPRRWSSGTRTSRCTKQRDGFQIFNPGSPTERRRSPHHTMGLATVEGDAVHFELITLE